MRKKVLASAVVGLMVFVSIGSFSFYFVKAQSIGEEQVLYDKIATENEIFKEIEETVDKVLVVDKIIGDIYVKYWEHAINDVSVKNDSILLHLDPETGDISKYKKSWTDIELDIFDSGDNILPTKDYHWKKAVVFPDKDDSGIYCTFYVPVVYPLVCWEVRYTDGTTIFYDSSGSEIGYAVPAPSEGCTLRGWGDSLWNSWRDNARGWYDKWCSRLYAAAEPTVGQISNYISNPDVEYFYVIAHSDHEPTRFEANGDNVYYTAGQLEQDMLYRSPMNLAVLCCCSAMEDTGDGTLSYEFRKGQMDGTVTIGYYNMGECGAWPWHSIPWQNAMFANMTDYTNYTMKEAFDLACAEEPGIAPYVRFVGDETLRIEIDDHVDLTGYCNYYLGDLPIPVPIKNVKVNCIAENPDTYYETTYTDSNGYYEFTDIPRFTTITVSASKFGYQPASPNPTTFVITTPRNLEFKFSFSDSFNSRSSQQQSTGSQQYQTLPNSQQYQSQGQSIRSQNTLLSGVRATTTKSSYLSFFTFFFRFQILKHIITKNTTFQFRYLEKWL